MQSTAAATSSPARSVVRDQLAPTVPLIVVAESVDESRDRRGHGSMGARDVVSLGNPARLQAVMARELRSFRLERALGNHAASPRSDARRQLETVLERSNDAIVQVQEGIVVDANPSWLELFGIRRRRRLVGQPIMDLFEEATHAGAEGRAAGVPAGPLERSHAAAQRRARGWHVAADGTGAGARASTTASRACGSWCPRGRATIAASQTISRMPCAATPPPASCIARPLLEALERRASPRRCTGGVRYFALVKPDKFAAHRARRRRRGERRMPRRVRRTCSRSI